MIFNHYFTDLHDAWLQVGDQFARLHSPTWSAWLDDKLDELCRQGGMKPEALEVGEGECLLWVRLHDGREAVYKHGALFIDGAPVEHAPPCRMLDRYFDSYVEPLVKRRPFPMQYVGKYDSRKLQRVEEYVA